MRLRPCLVTVPLLALLLCGCGTLMNTVRDDGADTGVPPRVIYGGVRTDLAALSGYGLSPFYPMIAVFDLPISFGVDTALLPFTIVREVFFAPAPVAAKQPALIDRW